MLSQVLKPAFAPPAKRDRPFRLALTAGLLNAANIAVAGAPAQAELTAECCADLEARIAELEIAAARGGNRKLSLTVSGVIGQSLLMWDDGQQQKAYLTDSPAAARPRFRFTGSTKLDADWSAGYLLEIGLRGNRADTVSQQRVFARRLGDPLP